MKIGILGGTGRMGKGLARCYVQGGHEVILGSRNASRAEAEAKAIASEIQEASISGGDLKTAAAESELVILAVPFRDGASLVSSLSDELKGKIIIDITNPFGAVPVGQISGIEHNAQSMGELARWVAAYKTTFWITLDQPQNQNGVPRDVLVCADDNEAKRIVCELIESSGIRAVDCGGLEVARTLDPMVPLMLEIDRRVGGDCYSSWKFLD